MVLQMVNEVKEHFVSFTQFSVKRSVNSFLSINLLQAIFDLPSTSSSTLMHCCF